MPATIIDSTIFGNIFSTKAMRDVWSDENRTAKYLDVERSLARVQGRTTKHQAKSRVEDARFKCTRQRSISGNGIAKRR